MRDTFVERVSWERLGLAMMKHCSGYATADAGVASAIDAAVGDGDWSVVSQCFG